MDAMSYLQGVVTRAIAIQKWKERSREGSILRNPVDLSDLMNPDTFLSAFKQYCARYAFVLKLFLFRVELRESY